MSNSVNVVNSYTGNLTMSEKCKNIRHVEVCREKGKFAGWPANSGIWNWGEELLCGFALADHEDKESGHTYNRETAAQKFARSRDGGETWSIEDAYEQGITAEAKDHVPGGKAVKPGECPGGFDFTHPDFAMTFRRMNDSDGTSHFYMTTDRGRGWQGPYAFPNLGNPGVLARTDYIVEGPNSMLAMLTVSKSNRREGRVGCFRTEDGGQTWRQVSWVGPEPEDYAIMPATVKTDHSRLVCIVRRKGWLAGYISDDNAESWRRLEGMIADTGSGNPPALVRLADGRLCLAYAVRNAPSRICVRFSENDGENWGEEIVLRDNDGANFDMGYPRMGQRPDGTLVLLYYYNHALAESPGYRYIAATLFAPA